MAIAYQTIGSATAANAATTCNFSVNAITANANGLLLHCAGYYDGGSETNMPTTVSGGETPVNIAVAGDVSHQYGRLRYDIEATLSTSYAITNTWTLGQDEGMACACLVFDGVDQTTVVRTSNMSVFDVGGSHVRTLVSITVGDMCGAMVADFNDNTHTASNCTERCDILNASGDTALFTGNLLADGTTEILGATAGTGPGSVGAVALIPASSAHTSTGAVLVPTPTIAGVAQQPHSGVGAVRVPTMTIAAVGVMHPKADGAVIVPTPTIAGAAAQRFIATGAVIVETPTIAAAAAQVFTSTGAEVVPTPTIAGVGVMQPTATGAVIVPTPTIAGVAEQPHSGTGAVIVETPTIAAAGTSTEGHTGTGALAVETPTIAAVGVEHPRGDGAVIVETPTIAGAGAQVFTSTGALIVESPTLAGFGVMIPAGQGILVVPTPTIESIGASVEPSVPPEPGIPPHIGQSFDPRSLYAEAEEIVNKVLAEFERKVRRAKSRKAVEKVIADQIPALRPLVAESFIPSYSSELLDTLQAYMTHDANKTDILRAIEQARQDEDEEIAIIMMLYN